MGREYRILLGFLGLLAGVFVGLLSKKLLVPRPPVGAGPDVDVRAAYAAPTEIVEPPRLSLRASAFAAAPPLVAAAPTAASDSRPADPFVARPTHGELVAEPVEPARPASMFARLPDIDDPVPAVVAASGRYDDDDEETADDGASAQPGKFEPVEDARPLGVARPVVPPPPAAEPRDPFAADRGGAAPPPAAPPLQAAPPGAGGVAAAAYQATPGVHVAQPGDSWWSIAEAAYGDGRCYRAVFAWNRAVDPRVSLAAGTRLELPPLEKLRAAWPALVPPAP
jgi:nucleoid-associated protein YgaU